METLEHITDGNGTLGNQRIPSLKFKKKTTKIINSIESCQTY